MQARSLFRQDEAQVCRDVSIAAGADREIPRVEKQLRVCPGNNRGCYDWRKLLGMPIRPGYKKALLLDRGMIDILDFPRPS